MSHTGSLEESASGPPLGRANIWTAWWMIGASMAVGGVLGLWSFGGPLPLPPGFETFDALPRRLVRLGHIAAIDLVGHLAWRGRRLGRHGHRHWRRSDGSSQSFGHRRKAARVGGSHRVQRGEERKQQRDQVGIGNQPAVSPRLRRREPSARPNHAAP